MNRKPVTLWTNVPESNKIPVERRTGKYRDRKKGCPAAICPWPFEGKMAMCNTPPSKGESFCCRHGGRTIAAAKENLEEERRKSHAQMTISRDKRISDYASVCGYGDCCRSQWSERVSEYLAIMNSRVEDNT